MLGRLACLAVLSVIAPLSACYSPPEPACGFVCGSGGACPDDYTCASDNICHRNGTPATLTCTTSVVPFDVQSVMATGAHQVKVTFTSIPDATQATVAANYSIPGLSITGTPALSGATVTLATSAQMTMTYTLTISNVTRASDGEGLTTAVGTFSGIAAFDVAGAAAYDAHSVIVHFSDTPEPSLAADPANYSIPGLTITGTPTVNLDNSVTLPTSPQAAQTYTLTVSNVKRAGDFEPLDTTTASFPGRPPFDVSMASSVSNTSITVKFSDPPDPTMAMMIGNYSVDGSLVLSGTPVLSNDTVTLTTSSQAAQTYTVTVTGVRRASDLEPLTTASTTFDGRSAFRVASAMATKNTEMTVTFSDPPDPTAAQMLGNYNVDGGLMLSGTPSLAGSVVTITTSAQTAQLYTVTVSNVTRASDTEAMSTTMTTFTGVTCSDTTLDGDETDVDCGGSICGPCANGLMCQAPTDCQSNNCSMNVCAP